MGEEVRCTPVTEERSGGLLQDWSYQSSLKSRLVLAAFRTSQAVARWPRWAFPLQFLVIGSYRVLTEWFLNIDLPAKTRVGPRLRVYHGHALVVHPATVIGADCTLRHSTTLGTRDPSGHESEDAPVLGDGVDVGASALILGPVRIGDRAQIGAGAVVVTDVPADDIVVGNPARSTRTFPRAERVEAARAERLEAPHAVERAEARKAPGD